MLTVKLLESQRDVDLGAKGMFTSYKLTVNDGSRDVPNAELFQRKDTPTPKPDDVIDGELRQETIQTRSGGEMQVWKIRKNAKLGGGFGGGGFRQRDPVETARIVRQHSQEMALRYAAIKASLGQMGADFKPSDLKVLIDWFQLDVEEEPAKYGELKPKAPPKKPAPPSDVPPAGDDEFVHLPDSGKGTPFEV